MASKKEITIPAGKTALYDKLIATNPHIERKGNTNPYTSCNGNMFTHFSPEGVLTIRLPEKEIALFIKKYKTTLAESYGIIRKEYVVVPDSLLKKTKDLAAWLNISYTYVKTLKPRPTTKNSK